MTQFYTRAGDDGFTGLLGEGKIPKYHPRTEALGSIDEATAALGIARASCKDSRCAQIIIQIQRDLYHLMSEVSATLENAAKFRKIDANRISWLEDQAEVLSENINIPSEFILPGDSLPGAFLDLARTIVRRAERNVAKLVHEGVVENYEILHYLNRLSSLLFILELLENSISGQVTISLAKE